MARRDLSEAEERDLIAAAEAARDAGLVGARANMRVAADASAVLSVRLPLDQLRAVRAMASARGESISALLQDAVLQLLTKEEPQLTATEQLARLWVSGIALAAPTAGATATIRVECPEPTTGYMADAAAR